MARTYQLKRRAEHQEATRQRIVEATVELHQTVGGTQATISAIRQFQRAHFLSPTGQLTADTMGLLSSHARGEASGANRS